jgi:hypothetical protein
MISNKDFVSMKTDVGEFIGDTSTAFLTRIGKYLNARYRNALQRYSWSHLFDTHTLTTTANQATYPAPFDFEEALYIWDDTNKVSLWQKPEIASESDALLTGAPKYVSVKEVSMANQPTSASTISFVSDSASDNTQRIFIKGLVNGYENSETITLGAMTPVATTNSYTKVTQISKSGTTAGVVTATSNSGAVTIATIPAGQLQARYRVLHFYYIPASSITMKIRYKRSPLPMVNDFDYPIIDIADELIVGAQADAWRAKRQFGKASELEAKYEKMLNDRIFQEEQNREIVIEPTAYSRDSYSNYGNY